jgi:oligopeptide transport system substrate-binding protein
MACTDDAGGPAPRPPGIYAVAVREPATLLPGQVSDSAGRMIVGALWARLPDVAEIASQDHKVWTIQLRPGLRFHDDTPVTAESYVRTWQTVVSERWAGARLFTSVLLLTDMRATDDTTITLTLAKPFANAGDVLGSLALAPLPESVLTSRDWKSFAGNPIGNGPYRLASPWRAGTGGKLTKFADYFGRNTGKAREIEVRVVADAAAQYEQVRGSALDLATAVPGSAHDAMRAEMANRHLVWPMPELTYLRFPLLDLQFKEASVRHAFALGVDRAALEAGPLNQQVDPARSFLPPIVQLPQRTGPCRPCVHDPAAAKSLLAQAPDKLVDVKLYFQPGMESWIDTLADQLRRALSIEITTKPLAPGQVPTDGPEVVTRPLLSPSPAEPMTDLYPTESPGFFDLLNSANAATNSDDRGQLYRLAENQVLRDLPVAPLWSAHGHAVWTDRLSGIAADPYRDLDLGGLEVNGA